MHVVLNDLVINSVGKEKVIFLCKYTLFIQIQQTFVCLLSMRMALLSISCSLFFTFLYLRYHTSYAISIFFTILSYSINVTNWGTDYSTEIDIRNTLP